MQDGGGALAGRDGTHLRERSRLVGWWEAALSWPPARPLALMLMWRDLSLSLSLSIRERRGLGGLKGGAAAPRVCGLRRRRGSPRGYIHAAGARGRRHSAPLPRSPICLAGTHRGEAPSRPALGVRWLCSTWPSFPDGTWRSTLGTPVPSTTGSTLRWKPSREPRKTFAAISKASSGSTLKTRSPSMKKSIPRWTRYADRASPGSSQEPLHPHKMA
eukprot:scaffold3068_cov401-Prasinococcus_capsulatus_cf.AAC.50